MRFAVLGNCQTDVFAQVLALYVPAAEIVRFDVGHPDTAARAAAIAEELRGFDRVFSHPEAQDRLGPLRRSELLRTHPDTVFFPSVGFLGFQPDCVYLSDDGGNLRSPLTVYHSALAAAAFTLGLDEERTAGLFNAMVYHRLGYFEEYAKACGALVTNFRRYGLEAGDRIAAWQRHVAFMFTVNHPRAVVIADIARMVLARLGHDAPELGDLSDVVGEPLGRREIFPVYPEIGRRLNLPGHLFFRNAVGSEGGHAAMDLARFLERSFAIYREAPARVAQAVARHPRARPVQEALAGLLNRPLPLSAPS